MLGSRLVCVQRAEGTHTARHDRGVHTLVHDHMRVHCCVCVVLHSCTLTHGDACVQHRALCGLACGHACTLVRAHTRSCRLADVHPHFCTTTSVQSLAHIHAPTPVHHPHTRVALHTRVLTHAHSQTCAWSGMCTSLHTLSHTPPAPQGLVRGPVTPGVPWPQAQGPVHAQAGVTARAPACPVSRGALGAPGALGVLPVSRRALGVPWALASLPASQRAPGWGSVSREALHAHVQRACCSSPPLDLPVPSVQSLTCAQGCGSQRALLSSTLHTCPCASFAPTPWAALAPTLCATLAPKHPHATLPQLPPIPPRAALALAHTCAVLAQNPPVQSLHQALVKPVQYLWHTPLALTHARVALLQKHLPRASLARPRAPLHGALPSAASRVALCKGVQSAGACKGPARGGGVSQCPFSMGRDNRGPCPGPLIGASN